MTRVAIERIAAGGDGVGRLPDGLTVFVPRSAPGDVLDVEIRERKARFARGRLVSVLESGPGRTEPPCPHYVHDRCGGCQLQHLAYETQLEAKRQIVADALRRLGGRPVTSVAITPSPEQWRYRTKLTLAARPGSSGKAPVLGMHVEGSPDHVFPLHDCRIASESLMNLWREVREHRDRLPPDLEGMVLRADRTGGLHLVVLGGSPWQSGTLAAALSTPVAIWWAPRRGVPRVVSGADETFPALAFEQVNPPAATAWREKAVSALGSVAGRVVWDLYGGVGDGARLLAAAGARVHSVDADRSAIEWARRLKHEGSGSVSYLADRAEDVLRRLPVPDAVIVNPPRTGLHARVSAHLERWAAARRGARAAYVSCDPATLARDLKRMPSLAIESLAAADQFPQTAHVECLVVLVSQ